jgi:hypothetical protein
MNNLEPHAPPQALHLAKAHVGLAEARVLRQRRVLEQLSTMAAADMSRQARCVLMALETSLETARRHLLQLESCHPRQDAAARQ